MRRIRKIVTVMTVIASLALLSCGSNDAKNSPASTKEAKNPTGKVINPTEAISTPTESANSPIEETKAPTDMANNPTEKAENPTGTVNAPTEEVPVPTETVADPTKEPIAPTESANIPTEAPIEPTKTDISPTSEKTTVAFDPSWRFADSSVIHSGSSVLYRAETNRKNIVIGVNAGHGTLGGTSVYTYCHPDRSAKITGGSTAAGAIMAIAVSGGMVFKNGLSEPAATLKTAVALKDKLLAAGFDVLMVRDGEDVQLDNVARTIMCNNNAACHIAIHYDGDTLSYDKGCYYISVPDGLKTMDPVSGIWQESERLGASLLSGLQNNGAKIYGSGAFAIDLTQTSYSTVPSVDIELGNQCTVVDDAHVELVTKGLLAGIEAFFA